MVMDAAERKRLIALGKQNEKIQQAILEEKRILAKKPIHRMAPDPRLKHLPKYADPKKPDEPCADKILKATRARMAAGAALMAGDEAPEKEAPKKEAPKPEKPPKAEKDAAKGTNEKPEKPKKDKPAKGKRGSTKVK